MNCFRNVFPQKNGKLRRKCITKRNQIICIIAFKKLRPFTKYFNSRLFCGFSQFLLILLHLLKNCIKKETLMRSTVNTFRNDQSGIGKSGIEIKGTNNLSAHDISPPPEKLFRRSTVKLIKRPIAFTQMQIHVQPTIFPSQEYKFDTKSSKNQNENHPTSSLSPYSHLMFPSYLHLSQKYSPHLLAHEISLSFDDSNEAIEEFLPDHRQEIQRCYPDYFKVSLLGLPNPFFYDLHRLSTNLSERKYFHLISSLFQYQNDEITKYRCYIRVQSILLSEKFCTLSLSHILSFLEINQNESFVKRKIPHKTPTPTTTESSSTPDFYQISNYFARQVTEFADHRKPPQYIAELPKYDVPPVPENPPRVNKSYIKMSRDLQSSAFAAFLFNNEYISCYRDPMAKENTNETTDENSAEKNNKKADDDSEEDEATKASRDNLDNYFTSTANVPMIQTKASTLQKAYSYLLCEPRPSFNLFPGYLVYSIELIYEKAAPRLMNLMSKNYEAVIPEIAPTILNAINKTNEVMPAWDYYLLACNAIFSAKHVLKIANYGKQEFQSVMKELNDTNTFVWTIGKIEKNVIDFLHAFLDKTYKPFYPADRTIGDSFNPYESFFNLLNLINSQELLIFRPFAAALLIVKTLVRLFNDLEDDFNHRMNDELFLNGKDRFILELSEKFASPQKTLFDKFLVSDAPFSMKMFLEYAIVTQTAKKDVLAQKLTFTTVPGFRLMCELDAFSSIISSFLVLPDFQALGSLYIEFLNNPSISYQTEVMSILQGREIIGIAKNCVNEEISYTFRKYIPGYMPPFSSSFIFEFGTGFPDNLSDNEGNDRIENELDLDSHDDELLSTDRDRSNDSS